MRFVYGPLSLTRKFKFYLGIFTPLGQDRARVKKFHEGFLKLPVCVKHVFFLHLKRAILIVVIKTDVVFVTVA